MVEFEKLKVTPWQLGLWLEWVREPESTAYNMAFNFKLIGPLNLSIFEQALQILVSRHAAFGTYFIEENEQPMQIIQSNIKLQLDIIDLSIKKLEEYQINQLLNKLNNRIFNLNILPLFNFSIIKISNKEHYFCSNVHHILTDGLSMSVFFKELSKVYDSIINNNIFQFSKIKVNIHDILNRRVEYHQSAQFKEDLVFWRKYLQEADFNIDFPGYASKKKYLDAITLYFSFPKEMKQLLKNIASSEKTTLFIVLMACFDILLYRYTMQEEVIINYAANVRNKEENNIFGYYINPAFSRAKFKKNFTFIDVINNLKKEREEVKNHRKLPIVDLMSASTKNFSDIPKLSNVVFSLSYFCFGNNDLKLFDVSVVGLKTKIVNTQNDLSLYYDEMDEEIIFKLWCSNYKFNYKFLKKFSEHFKILVKQLIKKPRAQISEISFLSKYEKNKLIVEWNKNNKDYPRHKTIHQLFEDQVEKTPKNIAVVYKTTQLTYQKLNQKSNQLAHYLQKNFAIKSDDLIVLNLDRSEKMLIAILAVLKSGAAYVPMDPDYPIERMKHILSDTKAKIVLTNEIYENKIATIIEENHLSIRIELIEGGKKNRNC